MMGMLSDEKTRVGLRLTLSVAAAAMVQGALFLLAIHSARSIRTGSDDPDTISVGDVFLDSPFKRNPEEPEAPPAEPVPFASAYVVQNNLPTDLFTTFQPDEKKLNALMDMEEGGTELRPEGKRSGGGGGDDADALIEGRVRTDDRVWARMKWKPDPNATQSVAGDESGRGESVPGTLQKAGAGSGLGNGKSSGALGSQGTGTGSGAGVNGSNIGNGLGTAPPLSVTQRPAVISMSRGAYPTSARAARHEGTVLLSVEVLPTGEVGTVDVRTSSGYDDLDQAAKSAAKDWRFTGALQDGKPIRFWYAIPYRFELTN